MMLSSLSSAPQSKTTQVLICESHKSTCACVPFIFWEVGSSQFWSASHASKEEPQPKNSDILVALFLRVHISGTQVLYLRTGDPCPACLTRVLQSAFGTVLVKGPCRLHGVCVCEGRGALSYRVSRARCRGCSSAPKQRGLEETPALSPTQGWPPSGGPGQSSVLSTQELPVGAASCLSFCFGKPGGQKWESSVLLQALSPPTLASLMQ